MLRIIEKTKIWFGFSLIIIIAGFVSIAIQGFEYGIDFKGGTVVEIKVGSEFNKQEADKIVANHAKDYQSAIVDGTSLEIKSSSLTDDNISAMIKEFKDTYKDSSLTKQENIGASMGKETRNKAVLAIVIATIGMLIYIGLRFEFNYGIAAILSLVHDVLVMISIYSIFRLPLDSAFVVAILTVIGYSINDTIVVFDRIRENGKKFRRMGPAELSNRSITQTMARSINTGLSVMVALIAMQIIVPPLREFTKPLLIGIISGSYSSIFIATPFWVIFKNKASKKAVA